MLEMLAGAQLLSVGCGVSRAASQRTCRGLCAIRAYWPVTRPSACPRQQVPAQTPPEQPDRWQLPLDCANHRFKQNGQSHVVLQGDVVSLCWLCKPSVGLGRPAALAWLLPR